MQPHHTMAASLYGRLPSRLKCLVWALQSLGLYCFKRPSSPSASARAELSLPLLFWTILVQTLQIIQILPIILGSSFKSQQVGWVTSSVLHITSTAFFTVGKIALIINGPILCQILSDCEENASTRVNRVGFSMMSLTTVLLFCSNIALMMVFLGTSIFYNDLMVAGGIIRFVVTAVPMAGTMVTAMVFREVLAAATKRLSVDFLLMDESSFGSGTMEADPRLNMLERVIREVRHLKEKIVDFFLVDITLLFCSIILNFITYAFYLIQYFIVHRAPPITAFVVLLLVMINTSTLLHICTSAHYFSKHVQRVSSQLMDARVGFRGEANKAQLQYLLWVLEKMETFDMGSWYSLGPNTLVSVTTFVLTYLVVMLQVGLTPHHLTTDEGKRNSS